MDVNKFMTEITSVHNPENRDKFLSDLINKKTEKLEDIYRAKSEEYIESLKRDIKNADPISLVKKLRTMTKTQARLFMILDNLVEMKDGI